MFPSAFCNIFQSSNSIEMHQRQPPEELYIKRRFEKFRKAYRKTPVPESRFYFIKNETIAQVFSSEFSEIFKNTFFRKYLWTASFLLTQKDKYR